MDQLLKLLASLATLSGVLVSLAGLLGVYAGYMARHRALARATEDDFNSAVNSDDINAVGSYLYERVGAFKIVDYASDDVVRKRVTRLVEKAREFIGEPVSIPSKLENMPPTSAPFVEAPGIPELDTAEREIREGSVWNGLARLRRFMEMSLRRLAEQRGLSHIRGGASRLASQLAQEGVIPNAALEPLKYAIAVANRGVHGLDVSLGEAEEAMRQARLVLSLIQEGQGTTGTL